MELEKHSEFADEYEPSDSKRAIKASAELVSITSQTSIIEAIEHQRNDLDDFIQL